MKIIDSKTGSLFINQNLIIKKGLSFFEVLNEIENYQINDFKNGYKWIYFKSQLNDELKSFYFRLCFKNDILFYVIFKFKTEFEAESWEFWNEDNELKIRDIYDEWLTKVIGKKRKFHWGKIGAFYDSRSCESNISINYN